MYNMENKEHEDYAVAFVRVSLHVELGKTLLPCCGILGSITARGYDSDTRGACGEILTQ
jgi:hypothetical protein